MAFVEDTAPFFSDFGSSATVGGVSVVGLFDNAYAQTLGFTAGSSPMLIVRAVEVPAVAQGASVIVGGVSYTVTGVEPDGTGLLVLRLQEA